MVKVYDKSYVLNFGKHKDKTIKWVLENEPAYLYWCHKNIDWFKIIDQEIKEEVKEAFDIEEEDKYVKYQGLYGCIDPYDFCF